MLIELDVARARLSLRSKVAAAVRRLCGLEMTPTGYRTMARGKRMEHRVRAPDNVEIHVLHFNRDGTVTVEFEGSSSKCQYSKLPV